MKRQKIVALNRLKKILVRQKPAQRIVFTNGCFDILHLGHIQYLEQAKAKGDLLVVGLNSDASVKRLKGKTRPILPQQDRARILAALACVDYVVLFEEDTPLNIIRTIEPDVLVKGGDWSPESIVGSEIVRKKGGYVLTIPYLPKRSTTAIIEKILETRCQSAPSHDQKKYPSHK